MTPRDIVDAIEADIAALGGYKRVGCALWPTDTPSTAHVRLLDKLNPRRREVLAPHELARIVELAAVVGSTAIADHLSELAAFAGATHRAAQS